MTDQERIFYHRSYVFLPHAEICTEVPLSTVGKIVVPVMPEVVCRPTPGRIQGYTRTADGGVGPLFVIAKPDQAFASVATPWEHTWSVLAGNGGKLAPVFENFTVVGHYGQVQGWNERTEIIVPARLEKEKLQDLIAAGEPVFVLKKGETVPGGWLRKQVLPSYDQTILNVVTTPDGQVLAAFTTSTGFLEEPLFSPGDFIGFGEILLKLGSKLGKKLAKSIFPKAIPSRGARVAVPERKVLGGPTKELADEAASRGATRLFRGLQLTKGYDHRMNIPEEHFQKMVEAAKETNVVAIFRANKPGMPDLIRKGAHGKPMWIKWKSDPESKLLKATTDDQIKKVYENGHFIVADDGNAYRIVNGAKEKVTVHSSFKDLKPGHIVAKDGKPITGDYDLTGVAPMESMGSNVNVVPKGDVETGDWNGPWTKKFSDAANKKFDEPRVLHGAQDGYGGNPKYMGLTDDTAYAVFPDGSTFIMEGKKAQEAFYEAIGRQWKQDGAPIGEWGWHIGVRAIEGGKK